MALPLAYHDTAAIQEVAVDVWKEVFEATGWPASLGIKKSSFGHDDIAHAFQQDDLSTELLYALETLHELGTEAGREAIVTAMKDQRIPLDLFPQSSGEREFALHLFLAQLKDATLVDVFARAQIQLQETGDQRRYNDFIGKEARGITGLSGKVRTLKEELLMYCQKSDLGEHVHVKAFEDDGVFIFNVLRSHHTRKPLAVVPGQTARATIQYRPVHGDILRYEASVGRLRIAARAASIVDFYRSLLGKVLFNDEAFFDGNSVCNLDVLRQGGRSALENHGVFGVGRVRMTECLWERGDRNLLQFRSSDCFRSMEELNLPLTDGTLLQAKLKIEIIGKSTRPVTVNIRVPSRIEVSQQAHEITVEKLLKAVGIYNSARPVSAVSLWTLHPWRHPIATWRTLFGKDTDQLVQEGILKSIRLESVSASDSPAAGRVLTAHAVSEGEYYGVSQVGEIPSRSLSPTDLDGYELVPEKFRLHLQSRFGLSGGGRIWDGRETLDLGTVQIGDYRLHMVYALRQPAVGVGTQIRAQASGAHSVLLVPAFEAYECELPTVIIESALSTRGEVMRSAINACGVTDSVAAIHIAPDGARLVVDSQLKKVWIDGLEIAGLPLDSHPFKLIELMVRRSPAPVSIQEISTVLSPYRQDGNLSARQAKSEAKKIIVNAMAAHGRSFHEDLFPSVGSGFYRCAFPPFIR
ncbi:hypothetical protein [Acidicapsa ligni]|uniref:hypothetical protein n=1 Tax=Acidicapsa ligni TaxID=542300 RepID=UPI0021DFB22F|nr:hypothetical protein [Acidicapsa ligni]